MSQASEQIARQYTNASLNKKQWGSMGYNAIAEGVIEGGVTDTTDQLQALVNKAISEGRRTIFLPHITNGQYRVTALANGDQVDFVGDNCSFVGGYSGTIGDMGGFAALEADLESTNASVALKADKSYTDTQLGLKADKAYTDQQIASVASGSPKGVYATLAALQTAFPSGNTNIYLVSADGKWYFWNGSAWTAGGTYQSTGLADNSISANHLSSYFEYRGTFTSGDMNTLTNDGVYLINGALANLPSTDTLGYLIVRRTSDWVLQEFIVLTDASKIWRRTAQTSTNNFTRAWVKVIAGADFAYVGSLSGIDLNTIKTSGIYITTGANTNQPIGSGNVAVMQVWGNGNFVTQIYHDRDHNYMWYRFYSSSGGFSSWAKVNDGDYISQVVQQNIASLPGGILNGKNIVCFGDSITSFGTYPEQIAQLTAATVSNVGFGGCRMANHPDPNYDKFSMTKLADAIVSGSWTLQDAAATTINDTLFTTNLSRLKSIDFSSVDMITVFYGTNDFNGIIPIGTDGDSTSSTFKGAINYIIDKILTAYPHLQIYFVTPIFRADSNVNGNSDTYATSIGYLVDYSNAINVLAKKSHLPSLDLYNVSGINIKNHTNWLSTDNVHPSTAGYTLLANKIAKFLMSF